MVAASDAVVSRLVSAGATPATVLEWIESRQRRRSLHRRALWCALGAWGLVTTAATAAGLVAFKFARDIEKAFGDLKIMDLVKYEEHLIELPVTVHIVPPFLLAIACLLLIGGLLALLTDHFPGLRAAQSAIDWEGTSDAVSKLLGVGCTYPDSFEVAAKVARTSSNRRWLNEATEQVKQGSAVVNATTMTGDTVMLHALLDVTEREPAKRWLVVRRHFAEVARRRLALLQATLPVISTLLAGLLIWISISATLGWMWVTVARMVGLT